ncbi:hypothetical protein [Thalassoroseus pseudoceratinae]|uniref:hypothetical protein n=1 Tax=Thalassoroseus pseudoceratinae TaxID=2713176 RepID=UPI00141E2D27|nr:hypothetical protein [Thalassoroseus pseudoceratinae]
MSQSVLPPEPETQSVADVADDTVEPVQTTSFDHRDEFEYRPMSLWASVTLFLGVCSLAGLVSLTGLMIGVATVLVGCFAVYRIRRAKGELSGIPLTVAGMVLAVGFTSVGATFQYQDYVNELPPGYKRVNFPKDISAKEFVLRRDGEQAYWSLHPEVEPLVDEKIFIKGYLWQSRVSERMSEFVLLKDNGKCCMGGDPKPFDMIEVHMKDGKTFDYTDGLVAISGVLRANMRPAPGEAIYTLEADNAGRAKTVF